MSAGVSAACPVSRRLMFSSTTIESSTTRPTATVRAARVKMFSENPPTCRPIMATSSDSGMEMAVISVERTDIRNSRITRTANPSPSAPSTVRSWIDCSISGAWSKTMLNAALLPIVCCRPGSASATACEMATESPSASLSTDTLSAGRPLARASEEEEIDSTLTSAILDSATGPSLVGIERALTCLTELVESPTCTASSRVLSYAVPAGTTVSWDWIGLGDGRGGQVALGQVVRAQGDGQLGGVLAGDLDLAYALDRGQGRDGHVLHELARGRQRQVGGGGQQQHRDVVGAAGDDVGLDIGGQGLRGGVDGVADVADDLVAVQPVLPVDADRRLAVGGGGRDIGDARDTADRPLDRGGDVVGHDLRRRAGVDRGDHRGGHLGRGQQLLLERSRRQHTEHDDRDRDQGDDQSVGETEPGQRRHSITIRRIRRIVSISRIVRASKG